MIMQYHLIFCILEFMNKATAEIPIRENVIPGDCLKVMFMNINPDPNFEDHVLSSKHVYGTGNVTYKNEIDLDQLLRTMIDEVDENVTCEEDNKECVKDLIRRYGSKHIRDYNADGTVNCDDLAILLYAGHQATFPLTIRCSFFWNIYRRNVAFYKHSKGVDVNTESITYVDKKEDIPLRELLNDIPLQLSDKDFFECKNGHCGRDMFEDYIKPCDGKVQCTDLSDEQDCEECPEESVQCLVSGVRTCLPPSDVCKYHPTSCSYKNGSSSSIDHCKMSSWENKFYECKLKLNKIFRAQFGEQEVDGLTTPEKSYRESFCRLQGYSSDEEQSGRFDPQMPTDFFHFKFINVNQSLCVDQVDQRKGACVDPCDEDQGEIEFTKCATGKCIDTDKICNGNNDCAGGDDETVGKCAKYWGEYGPQWNTCPGDGFPCPRTGTCIGNDLVCNGIENCEHGEDENSFDWFDENTVHYEGFYQQTQNWSLANPSIICFKSRQTFKVSTVCLALVLFFFIFGIFMEPMISVVPVEDTLSMEVDERIEEANYDFKRRSSDLGFTEHQESLRKISLEQVNKSLEKSEKHVISDLKGSTNVQTIKDHVVGSASIKIKSRIAEKMTTRMENRVKNFIFYEFPIFINICLVILFYIEYYVDFKSLIAFYNAGTNSKSKGFLFSTFMLRIFTINCVLMSLAHLINVCIAAKTLYIKGKFKRLSFSFFYPVVLQLSQAIYLIKENKSQKPCTLAKYTNFKTSLDTYNQKISTLNVVRTTVENIPQILLAFFMIISVPLRTEVISSSSPELVVLFIVKHLLSWIIKSWSLTSYYSILKKTNVGVVGKFVYCLSLFLTLSSRLLSIAFCLIFSTAFPDLPFIFYTLSEQPTYQQTGISPLVIDSLYHADVSPAPAFAVLVILVMIPFIFSLFLFCSDLVEITNIDFLLAAFINIFCPFVPSIKFKHKYFKNTLMTYFVFYGLFFTTNIVLLLLPVLLYGSHFFSHILPVIDELIRFYSFRPSVKLPPSFPTSLPIWYLHGNTIFPLTSVFCFTLGVGLFVLYHKKFHPWTPIPKKTLDQLKEGNE